MSPVTTPSRPDQSKNFQDLVPFGNHQIDRLAGVFALGDSDPRWSVGPGAENHLRLQRSLEAIATHWKLRSDSLSLLGDRYLAFYMAVMGTLIKSSSHSVSHSPIDKKEILAIVEGLDSSIDRHQYRVGIDGIFDFTSPQGSLHIVQVRNGETGIAQVELPEGELILDATSALPQDLDRLNLGARDWKAIILDATSWGGPRGVYCLAINPTARWKNPLPTLDTAMPLFGANYGLTLMAALELEEYVSSDQSSVEQAHERVREIVSTIPDTDIAGVATRDRLSLSFLYVESEELQRTLFKEGFLFDSGSACSSSALEPSHVLTRMGLLSHGNVRLRFRRENADQAPRLAAALKEAVTRMRA